MASSSWRHTGSRGAIGILKQLLLRRAMKTPSLIRHAALAAVLLYLAAAPAAALAQQSTPIEVENLTSHPAWITVYLGYKKVGKEKNGEFKDRFKSACVEAGKKWNDSTTYKTPELGPIVTVKANVYTDKCLVGSSRLVEGTYNVPKNGASVKGQVSTSGGSYKIKFLP